MKFDKIYVGRGIAAPTPVRRTTHLGEDTGDTFARILQEERDAAEAELQNPENSEPDTIVTRVLADGSVVTRAYKGARLISETTTHGNRLTPSKALIAEQATYLPGAAQSAARTRAVHAGVARDAEHDGTAGIRRQHTVDRIG